MEVHVRARNARPLGEIFSLSVSFQHGRLFVDFES